jgi:hypothetical protein
VIWPFLTGDDRGWNPCARHLAGRTASRVGLPDLVVGRRPDGKDILLVALVGLELLEPLLGVGLAGTGLVAVQLHEGVAHRGRHTAAVAADIDDGPLLQGLPHRVGGGPDGVLHVPVANGVCHCPRFSAPAF